MTEADIRAQVLGRKAGFISGVGPAPRKSYSRLLKQPTPQLATEFEDYKVEVKRLAQVVDQQAELIARLSAFLDVSQHPSSSSQPPPPPPPTTTMT